MISHHVVSMSCWQTGLPSMVGHWPFRMDGGLSLSRWWCSVAKLSPTLCDLSFTISLSLLKFMFTKTVMLSNHLMLCHPLFLLPLIFPSSWVFSNESTLCIRWPQFWSFSFSISLYSEYSRLILSDWLVWSPCSPRDSKESFEYHNSEAPVLQRSAFPMVQHAHPYMTTGKTIALTVRTFC